MCLNTVLQLLIGLSVIVLQARCTNRIVGGYEIDIAYHPYTVSIYADGAACGGALIRSDVVISAAHCFQGRNVENMKVKGGSSFLNKPVVSSNVKYVKMPTIFDRKTFLDDIALLKLMTPLVGPSIGTIKLPRSNPPAGVFMTATGWGATQEGGSGSNQLRVVRLKSVSSQQCQQQYRIRTTAGMFCAIDDNRDTCQGDSGGPLEFRGRIFGVISSGVGCARKDSPGVYTNIFYYMKWINATLESQEFAI